MACSLLGLQAGMYTSRRTHDASLRFNSRILRHSDHCGIVDALCELRVLPVLLPPSLVQLHAFGRHSG
jgi:hypothetical protein